MKSTYTDPKFTKHIKGEIRTILECGSRDCMDAIAMLSHYSPNIIYSFECNPDSIVVCEENIKEFEKIKLIKKAVSDNDGFIDFYATDMEKSIDKNIGASSALYHLDNKIDFIQKNIKVESIKMSSFIESEYIEEIDLLCLDLQGYERFVINGFDDHISKVKYIISEVSFKSYYENDLLFNDYVKLMDDKGFVLVDTISYGGFGDSLFKNKNN